MNPMVSVWCEFDIGQQDLIFRDAETANRWILKSGGLLSMAEEAEMSKEDYFQDLIDNGLIGTTPITVIE